MSSNFDDVGEFHRKFGLRSVTHGSPGPDGGVDRSLKTFRMGFLLEELNEYFEAHGMSVKVVLGDNIDSMIGGPSASFPDHAKAFDALIDLVYVAMGTAHLEGYPWQEGWDAVQKANMAKVRAKADGSDSARGSSFDVVKPEGWTAPDINLTLLDAGFKTSEDL